MKKLLTSGYALIIFSSIALSFKGVLVKVGYGLGTDPMTLMLMRLYIAAPCFIVLLLVIEGRDTFSINLKDMTIFALMGIGGMGLAMVFSFKSLELIDASINIVLTYTYPAITVIIMALFFGESLSLSRIFSLIVTFAGLILVVRLDETGLAILNDADGKGAIFALASALLYALYNISGQKLMKRISPLRLSAWGTIFLTAFYGSILGVRPYPSSPAEWGVAAILGVFCGFALMYGIKAIGASRTAIVSSFGPVFAVILAHFLLGEGLDAIQITGMIMVISGILLLKLRLPIGFISGATSDADMRLKSLSKNGGEYIALVYMRKSKGENN